MSGTTRQIAVTAALVATGSLLVAAWNGYRAAALLLLFDALPLCG